MPHSPLTLRGAAVVQAAEALMVLGAAILAGVDAAAGRSYHVSSGIALTVIGVACAAALAVVAVGLGRARRWARTPALLTQLFVGIVGIYLLQGSRLDWGVASVVLAGAGFAALLSPPSVRALTGPRPDRPRPAGPRPGGQRQGKRQPGGQQTGKQQTGERQTGNQQPGGQQTGKQQTGERQTGNQQPGRQQTGNQQPGEHRPSGQRPTRRRSGRP
jgi:hypothetical protein